MKMPSWLKKTKNDAEASSSRSAHRGRRPPSPPPPADRPPPVLLRQLPPAPRPEDYVACHRASSLAPRGSVTAVTCRSRSARWSGQPTRASTTLMSASLAAGTSTGPGCRSCRLWQGRSWMRRYAAASGTSPRRCGATACTTGGPSTTFVWEHMARCRSTFHDEYHTWEAFPIEDSLSRRGRQGRGRRP
jgi:hypothetical protein